MWSFFSSKGGVGCSVVAAAFALDLADERPVVLVDLGGDQRTILGAADWAADLQPFFEVDPDRRGPAPDLLRRLEQPVAAGLDLLTAGPVVPADPSRVELLASALAADQRAVVIDVGTSVGPGAPLLAASTSSILVTTACYLALAAAVRGPDADHVVVVREAGRAITDADIASSVRAPVAAGLRWDPAVARAVDAGLLLSRRPRSLSRLSSIR